MNDHLSPNILSALADGELTADQLAEANQHFAECPLCASSALHQSLLKSATAKAGHRYAPPLDFEKRMIHLATKSDARIESSTPHLVHVSPARQWWAEWAGWAGWAAAAALLIVGASLALVVRNTEMASVEHASLATEVFDQHIATLAASQPPQVLSTDRHTVKPWFQGKIPFTFNLPENLPKDTTLDGANLTYLHNQPVAQLLYSIGKHRVSVFVRQTNGSAGAGERVAEHAGFHVAEVDAAGLEIVAVSDVDPARLAELTSIIGNAQSGNQKPPK